MKYIYINVHSKMFDINVHWEMITIVKTVNISIASCTYLFLCAVKTLIISLSEYFKYTTWLNKDFFFFNETAQDKEISKISFIKSFPAHDTDVSVAVHL